MHLLKKWKTRRGRQCNPHRLRAPLPISAPIDRVRRHHGQPCEAHGLAPLVHPAVIFAPCGFGGVAGQIGTGDVVVVANLAAAEA